MIEELYIRNLTLIDELRLEFSPGLNIFTGETGAGKSVILNAVGLALGERRVSEVASPGKGNANVQIAVSLPTVHPVWRYISETDFANASDPQEGLILSRQISESGRSRCHLNGQMVNLSLLQDVGNLLVDIHGQHEHQSLFRSETHMNLLDAFGKLEGLRLQVSKTYDEIHTLRVRLTTLSRKLREAAREKELLEFQLDELENAQLQEDEEEHLTNERNLLNNAETRFESAKLAYDGLYGGNPSDASIIDNLKAINRTFAKLSQMDGVLITLNARLESALYELEDISYQIRDYRDSVEFNSHRLAEVEERLDLIQRLKRKYGNSIAEIFDFQKHVSHSLKELNLGSERIEELDSQIQVAITNGQQLAVELSEKRKKTAARLESLIETQLRTLGMDKAVFKILVRQVESPNGILQINGRQCDLKSYGVDEIEFLMAPNVGTEPKSLAKIASGGEISRVMLAVKTALARVDNIPSMIYDEIDVGIGGRTADIVGQKLEELARSRQVICITHLPQIARLADKHFRVEKHVKDNRTTISAKQLNPDERVEEIARMHGGELTENTLARARELLKEQNLTLNAPEKYAAAGD